MSTIRTARDLLSAYADQEPWQKDHDEAQGCFDIEDTLNWGAVLFRGLARLESRIQSRAGRWSPQSLERMLALDMPALYSTWLRASELRLKEAEAFAAAGYQVDGLDEFRDLVEEARNLVENLAFEAELMPIEDMQALARPENPDPDRYGS